MLSDDACNLSSQPPPLSDLNLDLNRSQWSTQFLSIVVVTCSDAAGRGDRDRVRLLCARGRAQGPRIHVSSQFSQSASESIPSSIGIGVNCAQQPCQTAPPHLHLLLIAVVCDVNAGPPSTGTRPITRSRTRNCATSACSKGTGVFCVQTMTPISWRTFSLCGIDCCAVCCYRCSAHADRRHRMLKREAADTMFAHRFDLVSHRFRTSHGLSPACSLHAQLPPPPTTPVRSCRR